MRHALLFALLAAAPAAASEAGKLGVGAILGVPFGATGKYWFDARRAAQTALGISDGNFVWSADYLLHFDDVLPRKKAGRLPLYGGLGLKLKTEDPTFAGVRFVGGVSAFNRDHSVELFAEIAPVLRFAPDEGGAFDGAAGIRAYFQ